MRVLLEDLLLLAADWQDARGGLSTAGSTLLQSLSENGWVADANKIRSGPTAGRARGVSVSLCMAQFGSRKTGIKCRGPSPIREGAYRCSSIFGQQPQ